MADNNVRVTVVFCLKVFMRFATVFSALLFAAGVAATASPLHDPQILIDTGGDSMGITVPPGINQVQPCGSASCVYDFFNDTGSIITSFKFQTTVRTNLSPANQASFTCSDPSGFFLGCSTTYTASNGTLIYLFDGVNDSDGDEGQFPGSSESEIGEREGIPLLGHFVITLNGWTPDPVLFQGPGGTPPSLTNTFATDAPEPSASLLLGTGLLLLVVGINFRRRRLAR